MPRQPERKIVEEFMIKKLVESGWKYVPGKDLNRESYEEPLLIGDLIVALKRINAKRGIILDDEDIKQVLNELKLRGTGQEANKEILNFLKNGISIRQEKTKDLVRVWLFDYKNIENNDFIVSNQVIYQTASDEKRPDIILYVNGIPLVIIECKDPGSLYVSWENAYHDIKEDYEKTIPELFKYTQIGIAAESIVKYFPIVPWQENVKIYEWKDEIFKEREKLEIGKDISMLSALKFLSKESLLDIIKNYLFFREEQGEKTKVIVRYMQKRAVEKIVNRVKENLNNRENKNKGLIWHWQGSGKTLTMIFAANKLYKLKELKNPTILFILDRIELEEQINNEFNALGTGHKIEPITSISKLKQVLKHDQGRGKRGFFSVLIHKFRQEELKKLTKELKELSKENKTIFHRKNIVAFIDEGHRTQYGLLAAQMKNIFKKAFFFAFTGTPVEDKGKSTYNEFAYPPEEYFLDRYFITESINDGFTVKIAYQPRLENVEGIHFDKEKLDILLEIEDEELPKEKREEIKEKVKKKINFKKIYYENKERISKIAKDISEHFKQEVAGKFKSMIVCGDRKACVFYKKELDKYLDSKNSEIVMTFSEKDSEEIKEYLRILRKKYPGKEIGDIRKNLIEKYKEENSNLKILIVTDMLLTGFDVPILQTMYLDKPLKDHRLLQAIARTNRPYKNIKEAGLIVDYLGILRNFKKAFEKYNEKEYGKIIYDKEELRQEFQKLLKETLEIFGKTKREQSRESILQAIDILSNEEKAKQFIKNYKELRKQFELLGSDPFKVEVMDEFSWLSYVYINYLKLINQKEDFEDRESLRKYFLKTLRFIHKTIKIEELKKDLPIINFDEEYLKKLNEKYKSKEEKAANIIFTLNRYVLVDQYKNPVYESLSEKVAKLIEAWKTKSKDFEKIYQEGLKIIKEINEKKRRQKELNLTDFQNAVLLILEKEIEGNKGIIEDIKELSRHLKENYLFSQWQNQITVKKDIEKEIRKFLINYTKKYNLSFSHIDKLTYKIMDCLKKYEKRG